MAFVTASALSVALFKLSFASCKEVAAVSSSDFAEVKLLPASYGNTESVCKRSQLANKER